MGFYRSLWGLAALGENWLDIDSGFFVYIENGQFYPGRVCGKSAGRLIFELRREFRLKA